MNASKIILSAAAATLLSTAAFGQALGNSAVDDRLETLNDSITDDFERDVEQFGNEGRALGYTGSLALQTSATSGNSDTYSIGLGANMGYYDGSNGYDVQFSYTRSENEGVVDDDSLLYEAQYTRDLSTTVFGFGKLQGSIDNADLGGFDTEVVPLIRTVLRFS